MEAILRLFVFLRVFRVLASRHWTLVGQSNRYDKQEAVDHHHSRRGAGSLQTMQIKQTASTSPPPSGTAIRAPEATLSIDTIILLSGLNYRAGLLFPW